jgi:hypothetical protein
MLTAIYVRTLMWFYIDLQEGITEVRTSHLSSANGESLRRSWATNDHTEVSRRVEAYDNNTVTTLIIVHLRNNPVGWRMHVAALNAKYSVIISYG